MWSPKFGGTGEFDDESSEGDDGEVSTLMGRRPGMGVCQLSNFNVK